ncbi:DMT family transporter [Lederbergia lenta]|uniref:SugE protein n=1 Tax=Lederbergia lenta TaxID=1467 RepID=A0A2X4VR57_LEDLE|nr:multidrug efflux SMR transporter [Lederbergia lenta]MCM3113209.1 multidrug efflux SMR transporter [Lederbergia lenta]MEC2326002.1 multidrug efflux SMR transporter [Lederbergia lenta]SQI53381.1 sugE protein [Lederbergia lenta]
MAWLYVLFAAIVEVFWVIGLRYSDSLLEWSGTIIMIVLSFYFIIKACEQLPAGTVYAIFTGSGAVAIVFIDFLIFEADFSISKIFLIGLIITGVVGIKMTTENQQDSDQSMKRGGK